MSRIATLCLLGATAALAGCMTDMGGKPGHESMAPAPGQAVATLTTPAGVVVGTARLSQTSGGIRLIVDATGLPPGTHGLHVHTVGRCEAPDFASAGGHWNPTMMKHGKDAPDGPHNGDLPNLIIGTNGKGHLEGTVPGSLMGGDMALMDTDSAAVVIHATADDYKTDPSGNSGGRIACGVVTPG